MMCPVPPAVPICPMMARIRSLPVQPAGSGSSTVTRMLFGRGARSVWVASTCSLSEVPMPKASAPNAPCVAVWLSQHTTVVPGRVNPCSGPMTWTMPWRGVEHVEDLDPERLAVRAQGLDLEPRLRVLDAQGAVGGRHVVVGDREGRVRATHAASGQAQPLERLGREHLVQEVPVDVEEVDPVVLNVDEMAVPDLLEEGLWSGHGDATDVSLQPDAGEASPRPARLVPNRWLDFRERGACLSSSG